MSAKPKSQQVTKAEIATLTRAVQRGAITFETAMRSLQSKRGEISSAINFADEVRDAVIESRLVGCAHCGSSALVVL